jgi:DNA-binding phage protein
VSTMINYDVAEYLRTEGDRAAYLDAWLKHSRDDAAGIVRAKADVARAADLIKL